MINIQQRPEVVLTQYTGYSTILGCCLSVVCENDLIAVVYFHSNTKNNEYLSGQAGQSLHLQHFLSDAISKKLCDSIIPMELYDSEIGKILYG